MKEYAIALVSTKWDLLNNQTLLQLDLVLVEAKGEQEALGIAITNKVPRKEGYALHSHSILKTRDLTPVCMPNSN